MSSNTVTYNNGQQLQINTNLAKLFPRGAENQRSYSYTNSGYTEAALPAGTVMGVIAATGKIIPMTSGASDGSQIPRGILARDYVVPAGVVQNLSILVEGQVRQDMIILQGSDTLSTVVSGARIFERIGSDTVGILIIAATNATNYDNAL